MDYQHCCTCYITICCVWNRTMFQKSGIYSHTDRLEAITGVPWLHQQEFLQDVSQLIHSQSHAEEHHNSPRQPGRTSCTCLRGESAWCITSASVLHRSPRFGSSGPLQGLYPRSDFQVPSLLGHLTGKRLTHADDHANFVHEINELLAPLLRRGFDNSTAYYYKLGQN